MRRPASREADGFILLEALVALVLLLVTIGLVASLLSFGQRVAGKAQARDAVVHMATGSRALEDWLVGASAFRPVANKIAGPVLFEGRSDRLSFVATSNGDVQAAGLLAVTVGFGGHKAGALGAILFDAIPFGLGEATLPDQVAKTLLIGQVEAAQFSYFGATRPGVAPDWRDDWTAAAQLPQLVALDLSIAVGPRPERFRLTFRVRTE